jgi:hypothetical protein
MHPCFAGSGRRLPSWPTGGTYFDEGWWTTGADGLRGRVGANHRTISTYVNLCLAHGFRLEHMAQPTSSSPEIAHLPTPLILVMRWRRRVD